MTTSSRQLWLATIASGASTLGSAVFGFGLSLYLLATTGSSISFALSVVIQPLVALALAPVVGPFVDRHSRKRVINVSQLVSILALAGFWLTYSHTQHLFAVSVVLLVCLRASDQFTSTAQQAAKINLVAEKDLQALAGYEQAAQSLSGIFASMLAAALYAALPFPWLIGLEIACEALALGLTILLNFNFTGALVPPTPAGSHWQQLREGWHYLRSQKTLFAFLGIAVGLNLLGTIDAVGLPLLLLRTMKLPAWRYALGNAAFGVGMLIASLQLSRRPPLTAPLLHAWHCSLAFGLWLGLLGTIGWLHAWPNLATGVLIIVEGLIGWNQNWLNVPMSVWMQETIPQALQGRVFGLLTTFVMAAMPLGVGLFTLGFSMTPLPPLIWQPLLFILAGITAFALAFFSVRLQHLNLRQP